MVSFDARLTVRGDRNDITAEALSLHVARRAADTGIPITEAREDDLRELVTAELGEFESFLVLFVESATGIPTNRRAGARSSGSFDLAIPGAGGYVYRNQVSAAS